MIISEVIQAQQLTEDHKGRQVILRRARTDKGHQFQDLVKGTLVDVNPTNYDPPPLEHITLLIENLKGQNIVAWVKPEWAVIFPIDGAGHTW